ncbi:MAG: transglutaminase domain-containing protein [Oscillospiraceae bacterium]|nr:transglutaminase domain-containing protein [Oscillospiraceae bacterium]
MSYKRIACLGLALALLLLSGCAPASAPSAVQIFALRGLFGGKDAAAEETPATASPYVAPAFLDAAFHADQAEGSDAVRLDLSGVNDGYVAVSAVSEKRLKCQVILDDQTYTYNLASDGTPSIFPLQCGDGTYRLRVMENVVDSKYAELFSQSFSVSLSDAFQPFLRPSDYVDYQKDSACVAKASELAQSAGDALGLVGAVYDYVCATVTYDRELAASVKSGYLPVPDRTLQSGKGICFDYAALAAAMLRSQGIPTKMVFGYVAPDQLYHAWNMFYTAQTGWVAVKFEVTADSWVRIDLTFAANGADSKFIGDGSNYSDVYYY